MVISNNFIHIDTLSTIMLCLIGFVSVIVASFSLRYLSGDRRQPVVFFQIAGLTACASIMVVANNIVLFLASWMVCNTALTSLMRHKQSWSAAKQSAYLARRNFRIGALFLTAACALLFVSTGATSIQSILHSDMPESYRFMASLLLVLTAMTQSALWPFHTWLLSSLNSPTPVSALMHAGIVNGGGFLLVRFSPLLWEQPLIMQLLFISGIATALVGTLWKLLQSDVKRMLACSTMGQMGFMVAQCGLGLFPAAVAHLFWHGLFKAYLFLSSGSAAQEKRVTTTKPPSALQVVLAILCGTLSVLTFSISTNIPIGGYDTRQVLLVLAMIAGTQCAVTVLQKCTVVTLVLASACTVLLGAIYGISVSLIEHVLSSTNLLQPQPLGLLYGGGLAILIAAWFIMLVIGSMRLKASQNWLLRAYVVALNASQPHPSTVTAHRNAYRF